MQVSTHSSIKQNNFDSNAFAMGAVHVKSTPKEVKVDVKATGAHTPLPQDAHPYQGSALECLLVTVPVQMSGNFVSGLCAGSQTVTSNVDAYYSTMAGYLQQGYTLNTFYRVPGSSSMSGFSLVQVPYEALYSRPFGKTTNQDTTRLLVEKCTTHLQHFRGGILSTSMQLGTVADTSDIMKKIIHHSSMGGRLICVEINGQVVTQGMSAVMSGMSQGIGVDVFFEIPNQPMPAKYVYQVINVPIGVTVTMGFQPHAKVQCDWLGTLAAYLNQGWKLVEIFLDQSQQTAGGFSTVANMNSIWFFEKEASRLQDPRPMYEGAVIEYLHKVSVGFGGSSVKTDWSPVIVEMGKRGWELACIQETPEAQHSGFGKIEMKLIMFFQRRLVAPQGAMPPPPAYPGDSSALNPPDQPSQASHDPLPEKPYPPS